MGDLVLSFTYQMTMAQLLQPGFVSRFRRVSSGFVRFYRRDADTLMSMLIQLPAVYRAATFQNGKFGPHVETMGTAHEEPPIGVLLQVLQKGVDKSFLGWVDFTWLFGDVGFKP